MSFELQELREAADQYAGHYEGTHGIWPKLVWERRNESPAERLDDLVDFLGKWKALRFKGGGTVFRRMYEVWLKENLTILEDLHGEQLYKLAPEDFQSIFHLSSRFRSNGAPPTTVGKALHFLLPETILLWDQKVVRNTFKLGPEPKDFVSYQRFGWKLLHHVTRGKGIEVLEQLEREHARSTGYFEPMTMILDHLAYSRELSTRAVSALGGPMRAFSDIFSQ